MRLKRVAWVVSKDTATLGSGEKPGVTWKRWQRRHLLCLRASQGRVYASGNVLLSCRLAPCTSAATVSTAVADLQFAWRGSVLILFELYGMCVPHHLCRSADVQ